MSERFDAIAAREAARLRSTHPGVLIRPPACEALPNASFAVTLDIRGPEFQELVAGPAALSSEQALEAAFEEAAHRLRRRAERRASAMRVVLACAMPETSMETAS